MKFTKSWMVAQRVPLLNTPRLSQPSFNGSERESTEFGSTCPIRRLTGSWPGPTIMSGMVIRRIVTAILAEVLLGDIVKTGLMAVSLIFFFFFFWAAERGTGRVFVWAGVDDSFF